jgi:hypothetical protein
MGNPRTGYYQCPRCNGRDVYESEETTGAMAMTLNTPGPVDPTIVNPIKGTVVRCRNCGEIAKWYDSAETVAYKAKRDAGASTVIGYIGGIVFLLLGLQISSEGLDGTRGLMIGCFVASAISFLIGFSSYSSSKEK